MCEEKLSSAFRHPELASEEYLRDLGNTKRFAELLQFDPDFARKVRENPREPASPYLDADAEELRLLWDPAARQSRREQHQAGRPVPELPLSLQRFNAYQREKLEFAKEWLTNSDPADHRMAVWRKRHVARTCSEMGPAKGNGLVHVPVAIELCVGCSVGCWFCSVAAERLSRKAEYAAAKGLWQEILRVLREVLGAAGRWGFCYWATDPLDNPDYEQFCCDFADVFGRFPQTTTAIAWKDTERVRALHKLSMEKGCELNRFSILTLSSLHKIYDAFRPEQLLQVELLPLNKESGLPKAFSGRARLGKPPNGFSTHSPEVASTTACVSGFILNIVDRTVRLITPCSATERWPMGHWEIDRAVFQDAEDLRRHMENMIATHMTTHVRLEREVRLRRDLSWSANGDPDTVHISSRFVRHDVTGVPGLERLMSRVEQEPASAADIALALERDAQMPLENTMYVLNHLFERGLLDEEP